MGPSAHWTAIAIDWHAHVHGILGMAAHRQSQRDPEILAREYAQGLRYFSFCCELYAYQVENGKYFLHEHPAQATSWHTDVVKKFMRMENVNRNVEHQCQYGAEFNGQPIKKPTGVMSNCSGIRKAVSKTCTGNNGHCSRPGGGEHVLCNGRVARVAVIFPSDYSNQFSVGFATN